MLKSRKTGSLMKIIAYFVYGSFLLPRGPMERIPFYKDIATFCVWCATFVILFFAISRIRKRGAFLKRDLLIFAYFLFVILITFVDRMAISGEYIINGYQKIFAYPAIALFTVYLFRLDKRLLLNVIVNITMTINAVNLVMPTALTQITFIGHVQVICQFCMLSLFCAVLHLILYRNYTKRDKVAVLLSIAVMAVTDALTAKVICVFCVLAYILYRARKNKVSNVKFSINPKVYMVFWIGMSVALIAYALVIPSKSIPESFSGRTYIWKASMEKVVERPLLGYGIEGVLLTVFWSGWYGSSGFNYAHNQFLQNLMDGGILCLILFVVYFYGSIRNVSKIKNDKIKCLCTVVIISICAVMLFESISLYSYSFITLGIIYAYSNMSRNIDDVGRREVLDKGCGRLR